ncbi:galectin-5-like [Notamacropus eugenii]|uniref:galectin-5-like n=1 Tax=Notamacropus eugenii TaxID=9315 RepID=UPI003B67130E
MTNSRIFKDGQQLYMNPVGRPGVGTIVEGGPGRATSVTLFLPFDASISGGLSPDKSMTVIGSVLPSAYWFVFNLTSGNDIVLHLNPRFQDNAVIRNSQISGSWGPKERSLLSAMPFIRGQTYQVWMTRDEQCFKVIVNGQHLFHYNHRVKNLPCINELEVAGDIHLIHVQT